MSEDSIKVTGSFLIHLMNYARKNVSGGLQAQHAARKLNLKAGVLTEQDVIKLAEDEGEEFPQQPAAPPPNEVLAPFQQDKMTALNFITDPKLLFGYIKLMLNKTDVVIPPDKLLQIISDLYDNTVEGEKVTYNDVMDLMQGRTSPPPKVEDIRERNKAEMMKAQRGLREQQEKLDQPVGYFPWSEGPLDDLSAVPDSPSFSDPDRTRNLKS